MATLPAGPFLLQIPYIVQGMSHEITLNVDTTSEPTPGSAPSSIELETINGEGIILSGGANELWGFIRPIMGADVNASTYTLWKANPDNLERQFISGGSLTLPGGSSVNPTKLASQLVCTLRSALGGIVKLTLIEHSLDYNLRYPLNNTPNGSVTALAAYLLSGTSFMLARDRSFPVAPLNGSFGQHETTYRRRFRS